jgi:hypothetical protein
MWNLIIHLLDRLIKSGLVCKMVCSRYNVRHKIVRVSLHVGELLLYKPWDFRIFRSRKLADHVFVTFRNLTAVLFNIHVFWDVITKIQLPDAPTASYNPISERKSTVLVKRM